jgi:hypothetical protein
MSRPSNIPSDELSMLYLEASAPIRAILGVGTVALLVACASARPETPSAVTQAGSPKVAPVTQVEVYVLPYYQSASTPDGRPMVSVGDRFDPLLASTKREDVTAARDAIRSKPQMVTPMTLMVLAIRLYDLGLRDESVFWFYVAKDRYITLAEVLDVQSPALSQAADAVRNFALLAGPVINGYAFCDPARQRELRSKALTWVEQNPYQVLFWDRLPARPGDRNANLQRAHARIRAGAEDEQRLLDDPAKLREFTRLREANQAEARFCWG